ncbi:hypothetical protein Dfri01_39020 [Dyadobacter frigoris]|uniref:hypothetical protein n=1 Tax=Dyadobacter frigoris TaxID=2576211 RepID=UPI0024A23747|nr:hypothetical protein [Dyadobacter frigoris]GLU54441.1 hypothetical protein Dfri01_39020 [Dyadobacter frigoris]
MKIDLKKIWDFWYFMVLSALICGLLAGCHRKRLDPFEDVPDLPGDTVYVTRLVDRCNYQYLSTDPVKTKKQLAGMIKALDNLIIHNDSIIQHRIATVQAQQAIIKTFPQKDRNQGS